jgi:hypothetical protein
MIALPTFRGSSNGSLDWRNVGPAQWPKYKASIANTISTATVADTLTTPIGTYQGGGAFAGGVLLPNGKVFCVPHNSITARIYDPISDILSTPTGTYPGGGAFFGGVLLPNGKVFCVPFGTTASRTYGGGASFNNNVLLSSYYNKF